MKYPIGIQNLESLIKDDYLYIDKTDLIYAIVSEGRYYFLSRPRRFGKSILLSTFKAYFEGKQHLFDGLAISKLETKWENYPIFYFDFNAREYKDEDSLTAELNRHLESLEKEYGSQYQDRAPEERFLHAIENAYEKTGKPVVILIDEYDKPLLQTINRPELQEAYRSKLKAFYSVMKTMDSKIKFAFITGVTKFSKVSVFSDLNNLDDISMWDKFASLCGITDEEIRNVLDSEVELMAEQQQCSKEECYTKLKTYYDGYHFSPNSPGIYNPFSLLTALKRKTFGSYWFDTGTPTFLVEVMKANNYQLENLNQEVAQPDLLGSLDSIKQTPIPLLFQSGYMTITGYDSVFGIYHLGLPNQEVSESFTKFLLPYYSPIQKGQEAFFVVNFVKEIQNGQPEAFMKRLEALFADGNYQVIGDEEKYFHNAVFIIFKMLGFYVDVEYATTDGRIDLLMKTKEYIYVLEFKINESADAALQQIEDKQYAKPFMNDSRPLYQIGVNFSTKTRRIDGWKITSDS